MDHPKHHFRLFTVERYIFINNVVEHVRSMAAQYEFVPPADSALDAVRDSADFLGISLSDEDAAAAITRLLDAKAPHQPRPLPTRQEMVLRKRLGDAFTKQPQLFSLRSVLLQIGGLELVAPPGDVDQNVPLLLTDGVIMEGPVTVLQMRQSHCHDNVGELWSNRHEGMICCCTGYALSNDGLWRQHSWALLEEGILETTERREIYFGTYISGRDISNLAASTPPVSNGG